MEVPRPITQVLGPAAPHMAILPHTTPAPEMGVLHHHLIVEVPETTAHPMMALEMEVLLTMALHLMAKATGMEDLITVVTITRQSHPIIATKPRLTTMITRQNPMIAATKPSLTTTTTRLTLTAICIPQLPIPEDTTPRQQRPAIPTRRPRPINGTQLLTIQT
jgi:hypothetical protein